LRRSSASPARFSSGIRSAREQVAFGDKARAVCVLSFVGLGMEALAIGKLVLDESPAAKVGEAPRLAGIARRRGRRPGGGTFARILRSGSGGLRGERIKAR
jgi:hypothetical protein